MTFIDPPYDIESCIHRQALSIRFLCLLFFFMHGHVTVTVPQKPFRRTKAFLLSYQLFFAPSMIAGQL